MTNIVRALSIDPDQLSRTQIERVHSQGRVRLSSLASKIAGILQEPSFSSRETEIEAGKAAFLEFCVALRAFLLTIVVGGAAHGFCWPSDLIRDLIKAMAFNLSTQGTQGDTFVVERALVSNYVQYDSRMALNAGLPWEQTLSDALQQRAQAETKNLSEVIHQVCGELESRCQNVESPLREEQARVRELQQRYTELEQAYGQLESDLMDRDLQIADMARQAETRQAQFDAIEAEKSMLLERVDQSESRLREETANARNQLHRAHCKMEDTEIRLKSDNARLMDEMESAQNLLQERQNIVDDLTSGLSTAKDEISRLIHEAQTLQVSNDQLHMSNKAQAEDLNRVEGQVKDLIETKDVLSKELEVQVNANREGAKRVELLNCDIGELRQISAKEKAEFVEGYRENAAQARAEVRPLGQYRIIMIGSG
ncbi:hypothetical protein ANO11243_084020 [Dothideomycetidae sp. 11243]|nr:hypothetical protein ANO11243_084020 [fungal sp. No.11243]